MFKLDLELIFVICLSATTMTWHASGMHRCEFNHKASLTFQLIRPCARSQQKVIEFDNTDTLEDCIDLARNAQGLAFNYAPKQQRNWNKYIVPESNRKNLTFSYVRKQSRQHYFEQLYEYFDCIVLQCPENGTFGSLIRDKRFNYYSLYNTETIELNFTCVPKVGLFYLVAEPETFLNATIKCSNITTSQAGSLAYVISEKRSIGLTQVLNNYNQFKNDLEAGVDLAYVNLYYNSTYQSSHKENLFKTTYNESINCFLYSAWEPTYPQFSGKLVNTSCVALTVRGTWKNTDCNRKLPFLCELNTFGENNYETQILFNLNFDIRCQYGNWARSNPENANIFADDLEKVFKPHSTNLCTKISQLHRHPLKIKYKNLLHCVEELKPTW